MMLNYKESFSTNIRSMHVRSPSHLPCALLVIQQVKACCHVWSTG